MTGNKAFASRGANIAFEKGIVVVASAGNSGTSSEPHVGVPAEANNVLAIGAVRSNRNIASFSSIGPSFDGRIKPDLMAQGQASVLSTSSGNIGTANGTSFSGPILAGMIATFWSAVPTLTCQEVVNYVKQSADRFTNPNNQYGYGIPDFSAALNTALAVSSLSKAVFTVYPNPASTQISVQLPTTAQDASISIYTSLGQLVQKNTINTSNTPISIEQLPAGIYMYQICSGANLQSGKLIKN
jgi:subtilisin family serine protease